jgi:tetratricopeptide (TPR) repeat protein
MMKYWGVLFSVMLLITGCAEEARNNYNANIALQNADYDSALQGYQAAQVESPDSAEFYYNAALAHIGRNEYSRAIDALNQALQTAEGDMKSHVYYNLGNTYSLIGRYADAIEAYQEGLRLNPDDEAMRHNLEIAQLRYIPPTPTAQEQQTEPDQQETDPDITPTPDPGGFDDPSPTPPPFDLDPTATPDRAGTMPEGESPTLAPRPQGTLTIDQAERILDQIAQDQQSAQEFRQDAGGEGGGIGGW